MLLHVSLSTFFPYPITSRRQTAVSRSPSGRPCQRGCGQTGTGGAAAAHGSQQAGRSRQTPASVLAFKNPLLLGPLPRQPPPRARSLSCRKTSEPSLLPPLIPAGLCLPSAQPPPLHTASGPLERPPLLTPSTPRAQSSPPSAPPACLFSVTPVEVCLPQTLHMGGPGFSPRPLSTPKWPNFDHPVLVFSPKSQLQCSGLFLRPV